MLRKNLYLRIIAKFSKQQQSLINSREAHTYTHNNEITTSANAIKRHASAVKYEI